MKQRLVSDGVHLQYAHASHVVDEKHDVVTRIEVHKGALRVLFVQEECEHARYECRGGGLRSDDIYTLVNDSLV